MRAARLDSIQALRAIAACSVMMLHVVGYGAYEARAALPLSSAQAFFAGFGSAGVDLFFVISGAIMYFVTTMKGHGGTTREAASFFIRRSARIFPIFWVTLAFAVWITPGSLNWTGVLLVEAPKVTALDIAWTLVFEMRFYLAVTIILLLARGRVDLGFALWAALQMVVIGLGAAGVIPDTWLTHYWTNPIATEFVFGVAVAALIRRGFVRYPLPVLAIGFAALVVASIMVSLNQKLTIGSGRVLFYGIPCALIFYGVVALELRRQISVPRWMAALGDASYSIYLWHYPVCVIIERYWVCGPADLVPCGMMYVVVAVALTLLLSGASYLFIEKPLMNLARRWTTRGTATASDTKKSEHLTVWPATTHPAAVPQAPKTQ